MPLMSMIALHDNRRRPCKLGVLSASQDQIWLKSIAYFAKDDEGIMPFSSPVPIPTDNVLLLSSKDAEPIRSNGHGLLKHTGVPLIIRVRINKEVRNMTVSGWISGTVGFIDEPVLSKRKKIFVSLQSKKVTIWVLESGDLDMYPYRVFLPPETVAMMAAEIPPSSRLVFRKAGLYLAPAAVSTPGERRMAYRSREDTASQLERERNQHRLAEYAAMRRSHTEYMA
ncbi:uncharacterized protein K452DRAFT_109982 [Aplosporella prunicola CBS 121167]|uniref:Uncharacterized protein n=1 Tax=Aplosporella prunicola CBS 121167 TaxID=1176127 RepID=A0A6A6BQW0_9PEZI|nr:uncharacterized protein K452DRAFT_109982 [Aplosporella prunicola CBS 121167]KAF2146400.1 hypothetical protein K452DRAFT_109982 [Aplosporella prunicola CBS 121167]